MREHTGKEEPPAPEQVNFSAEIWAHKVGHMARRWQGRHLR